MRAHPPHPTGFLGEAAPLRSPHKELQQPAPRICRGSPGEGCRRPWVPQDKGTLCPRQGTCVEPRAQAAQGANWPGSAARPGNPQRMTRGRRNWSPSEFGVLSVSSFPPPPGKSGALQTRSAQRGEVERADCVSPPKKHTSSIVVGRTGTTPPLLSGFSWSPLNQPSPGGTCARRSPPSRARAPRGAEPGNEFPRSVFVPSSSSCPAAVQGLGQE